MERLLLRGGKGVCNGTGQVYRKWMIDKCSDAKDGYGYRTHPFVMGGENDIIHVLSYR